jgi:hypothetical protein
MKNYFSITLLSVILLFSCKAKKKEPGNKFISVLSLIKGQVAHVDTSMYTIIRLDIIDSLHTDTTYIPREQFRNAAGDFLTLPDLSDKLTAKRFKEEIVNDKSYNRATVIYTPLNPKAEEVQIEEISFDPNDDSGDNVKSLFIRREVENRDSSMKKIMLWQMNRSFQVTTILQKSAQPETTTTLKITWNEDKYE